jgi:hypothetical protein
MVWWHVSVVKLVRSLCGAPEKCFVRAVVLAPRETRRATLVERDVKSVKWFIHVKC